MELTKTILKSLMRNAGIGSLAELARKAGVHRNSLSSTIHPFTTTYLSICRALEVDPLEILNDERRFIANTAQSLAPQLGFFLYGSRAKGSARKFSDYDIGVTGGESKLAWKEFLKLKDRFEECCENLPVKVSLLNFDDAPDSFLLDFESPMIFLAGNKEAFIYFKGVIHGRKKAA